MTKFNTEELINQATPKIRPTLNVVADLLTPRTVNVHGSQQALFKSLEINYPDKRDFNEAVDELANLIRQRKGELYQEKDDSSERMADKLQQLINWWLPQKQRVSNSQTTYFEEDDESISFPMYKWLNALSFTTASIIWDEAKMFLTDNDLIGRTIKDIICMDNANELDAYEENEIKEKIIQPLEKLYGLEAGNIELGMSLSDLEELEFDLLVSQITNAEIQKTFRG